MDHNTAVVPAKKNKKIKQHFNWLYTDTEVIERTTM